MKNFYLKLNLSNKLSFIIVVTIIISFIVFGLYFDSFLKKNDFENTQKRMLHTFERMASDILTTNEKLKKATSFIQEDEKFLASIELINEYEDKNNYNAILLDEEKKYIAEQLLNRVKISLNHDITLYDKNGDLLSYVVKEGEKYKLYFISYKNGQSFLNSKYDYEPLYTQISLQDIRHINIKHQLYYDKQLTSNALTTYHFTDNNLYIKAHRNFFSSHGTTAIGHIEISKIFDVEYFETLSNDLNIKVSLSTNKKCLRNATKLLDMELQEHLKTIQTDTRYFGVKSLETQDGPVFFITALEKNLLKTRLTQNRIELFIILFLMILVLVSIFRLILIKGLSEPLAVLMKQINKIEQRDYSKSLYLRTNDELQVISKNINTLATTIRNRENELRNYQTDLEYLSTHDTLTNVANRRLFLQQLEYAMTVVKQKNKKLAILFIDLDEFKELNDSLGHEVGDDLLKEVAKRLENILWRSDSIARIGGDEFYILLQNFETHLEVEITAQKVLDIFQTAFVCCDYELKTTASIGAVLYPDDGEDSISLMKNVDLAMYEAKNRGKNSFNFFSKHLSEQFEQRLEKIATLKKALKSCQEFTLFYQPKVSTKTGKIVAVEALVRWNSSHFGFVSPDQFIKLSEETKLIVKLGKWILHQACSDFVKLQNEGYILEQISVNVSTVQFQNSNMLETIQDVIKQTGMPIEKLELEITESFIATNDTKNLQTLQNFRDMGIGLAIDDFGTGFSSLSYLQKLPVTRLKIDKSFVDNIPHSEDSVALVKVIASLAKTFHLQITAEGVEKKEQMEFLKEIECDEIQGYYYSKPLPLDEFKKFYDKSHS